MPLLVGIIALFIPRFTIFMLWFFTTWFTGVFETRGWPILGFLFLPLTLLWYSAVQNWFGGDWNFWTGLIAFVAVLGDLSSGKKVTTK